MKLVNFNIRSFHSNGEAFSSLIELLTILPDIIVLTESWNNVSNVDMCNMDNYEGHHTYRDSGRGGGVSVFCHKSFNSSKISSVSFCNDILESCAVKVNLDTGYIVILGLYRPPGDGVLNFVNSLNSLIQNPVIKNAYSTILAGDTNINLNDINSLQVNNYLSCLYSSHFIPTITKFTRFPANNQSPSNLDHIFFNKPQNFVSGVLNIDITDHCPTFLHIPHFFVKPSDTKIKIQFRPCSQQQIDKFTNKLSQLHWESLDSANVNDNVNFFIKKLNDIYCDIFPIKTKYISQKRLRKPWLNQRIKNLINTKSDYYKLFKMGIISKDTNDRHKKIVNSTIKKAKKDYYMQAFSECKKDMRKSWNLIKNLMGKHPKKQTVKSLVIDNVSYDSDRSIAEAFNDFFTNIAQSLANNLPDSNYDPTFFLPPAPSNAFFFFPVRETECLNIIMSLKNTKTATNFVPVKIFKMIRSSIIRPLCLLINASLNYGVFPNYFKIARITQIFKSGNSEDPSNYRPISSLPYMSKIFEKCICSRLVNYFEKFSLFADEQYGFRTGKSTCDALLDMIEGIHDGLNNKMFHLNVLIDLKKAFDTVSHEILVRKLYHYGLSGPPLNLIKSFLSDRKQFVRIGDQSSSVRPNHIGLPQGSNLGPILFLIYLNDFPLVSNVLKAILFADDSSFSISGANYNDTVNNLNLELNGIYRWTMANKLTINVSKTQLILFSNRNTGNENNSFVSIGEQNVDIVTSCKYLGVYVDSKLTFKQHITYVTSKIAKNTGILFKIRDSLPLKARLDYYYSMIFPYLTYNVIVWGGTCPTHLSNLIVQHKRTIRILSDLPFNGHTTPVFHKYQILKFIDIHKFYVSIYMFKNKNSARYQTTHQINTRNRNQAQPSFNRIAACQRSISYIGPHIWNQLPQDIRNNNNLNSFKRSLKAYLLESYV